MKTAIDYQVRDAIERAAAWQWSGRCYSSVSLRRIAVEAGCDLEAIEHHFGSKQALFDHVLRRLREAFERALRPAPASAAVHTSPLMAATAVIDSGIGEALADEHGDWRLRMWLLHRFDLQAEVRVMHQDTALPLLDEAARRLGLPTPIVHHPWLHQALERALAFAAETAALGWAAGPAPSGGEPAPPPAWALSLQGVLQACLSTCPTPAARTPAPQAAGAD